jgi:ribonuclease P protein component
MEEYVLLASSQKFPKQERLTSKKIIEELFSKGSSVYLYPFRLQFISKLSAEAVPQKSTFPQVLFSVSKRNFKKAVDRNSIKRSMREIYRKNKSQLFTSAHPEKQPAYIGIVYVAKEKIPFELLEKKLILAWQRLVNN